MVQVDVAAFHEKAREADKRGDVKFC